ncbi:MAG: CHAT domain-containing protein [Chitinophagaceae bacterium]|nr:CHAT domain-containing protein [Chitinophagaceae bacterium]
MANPTTQSDKQALEIFLKIANSKGPGISTAQRVESFIKAGNIHQGYGRLNEAKPLYHSAISLNQSEPNPVLEYEAYLYLGSAMYFNGILDSAKYYWEKTAEISIAYRNKLPLPEQDRLYNSLGAIYYESANYQQARNFLETALELASPRKVNYFDYNEYYTTLKINISKCMLKMNQKDSAIRVLKGLKPSAAQKSFVVLALAHAYFEKGVYDSSLNLYKSVSLPNSHLKIASLNDMGRICLIEGKYKEAKLFLDSAIQENKILTGKLKNREEALSYLNLAELLHKTGKLDEALSYTNKALNEVHLTFNSKHLYDLPSDVSGSVSPINFFRILLFKAGLIYEKYNRTKDNNLLINCLKTYVKAIETANFISKNFDNDDAKFYFLGNSKQLYEQSMTVAYEICKRDQTYFGDLLFILESYKGSVLRQNLESGRLKKSAGIPDSLLSKESELKSLYAAYLTKLNMTTKSEEAMQIQSKLRSLMIELSSLQRLYDKYGTFSWLKRNLDYSNVPIAQLQKSIDNKTALLNYFISDSCIYVFVVTRQHARIEKIVTGSDYRKALNLFFTESLKIKEGQRFGGYAASHTLFKHLLEPVYSIVGDLPKIVIIPDGYLYYLPFDALIKTPGKRDYLLYDHSISLHYSFSLLLNNTFKKNLGVHSDSTLSFAPFTGIYSGKVFPLNMELPFSLEEIDNYKSRKFVGSMATKEEFLRYYKNFGILHLATHASLGRDSSSNWIQFFPDSNSASSGRLFVHEIYNLQLAPVHLVILSACETGSGLAAGGEGLLSVSRAFMYAGADGIVSTLYKTDDRVTAFLMKRLSHYIQKGKSPEDALRLSKIDLLNSDDMNLRVKSPNYWSNFVYIGKIEPSGNEKRRWIFIIAFSVIVLLAFFYRKKLSLKR